MALPCGRGRLGLCEPHKFVPRKRSYPVSKIQFVLLTCVASPPLISLLSKRRKPTVRFCKFPTVYIPDPLQKGAGDPTRLRELHGSPEADPTEKVIPVVLSGDCSQ